MAAHIHCDQPIELKFGVELNEADGIAAGDFNEIGRKIVNVPYANLHDTNF